MSTSDGFPRSADPLSAPREFGSALSAAELGSEVARLANAFFASAPPGGEALSAGDAPLLPISPIAGPVPAPGPLPPPRLGPSALNSLGAGGISGAATQPPVPGFMHTPPLAASPFPKEADLRPAPTLIAELLGAPSPLELMLSVNSHAPSDTPYFLEQAGLPHAPASGVSAPVSPQSALVSAPGARVSPPGAPFALPGSGPTSSAGVPPAPDFARLVHGPSSLPTFGSPEAASSVFGGAASAPSASEGVSPVAYSPSLVSDRAATPGLFDAHAIKRDFPILEERVHGTKRLIWLDNAATTQKPRAVIERLSYFYEHENSNIHRAAHTLAARATDAYEGARERVRRFLNAQSVKEIVFTRGATEAINLVAKSWGQRNIEPGDEIVLTVLEHHANIVPWQQLALEKGAKLRVAPVDSRGQIVLEEYERLFTSRTRIAAFTQVSNALGTITPARDMVEIAHRHGACVLVDGAQAVSHQAVDVQALDADFYVFSGHKVFAPTGIGVLYGKSDVLEHMPPWQGGGNMIQDVTFEKTVYQPAPFRFEAGTGNIADAVGLGAAIDYVMAIGLPNIARYEHELLEYATAGLCRVPGLTLIGTAPDKAGVLSFVLDGKRTEDVGAALDREGVAVRSGHHCAQPILRRFGLESTVRASLAPYNTRDDIDTMLDVLLRLQSGR